jgi:hypothetical protein
MSEYQARAYGVKAGIGTTPCWYCGEETGKPTREHLLALSKGGTSAPTNMVNACGPCNGAVADWEVERKLIYRHLSRLLGARGALGLRDKVSILDLDALPRELAVKAKPQGKPREAKPKANATVQGKKAANGLFTDYTSRKVGRLTVLGLGPDASKSPRTRWRVRCDCGAEEIRTSKSIRKKHRHDPCCVKCRREREDLTGVRFGKMTVRLYSHSAGAGGARWSCECDCGALEIRSAQVIRKASAAEMCGGCNRREKGEGSKRNE